MLQIKKIYRSNYQGENIVKDLILENQEWNKNYEYVPSNVENNQISNKAVVLGNGPSRTQLNSELFTLLNNHKGGLLASGKIQTYGCNALYRDYTPDFLVVTPGEIAEEIARTPYCVANIVYSNADTVLDHPGKFYLTPQNPSYDAGSIAAYLAAFDGHKTVYLMGFDGNSGHEAYNYNVYTGTPGYAGAHSNSNEAFFTKALLTVMRTYDDVEFVRVMPAESAYCPQDWKYQLNFRQISFRDFVIEVDL
jgi:hypothetical protein